MLLAGYWACFVYWPDETLILLRDRFTIIHLLRKAKGRVATSVAKVNPGIECIQVEASSVSIFTVILRFQCRPVRIVIHVGNYKFFAFNRVHAQTIKDCTFEIDFTCVSV